jgi:uncharacterized membrane protein (UPF0127 family)
MPKSAKAKIKSAPEQSIIYGLSFIVIGLATWSTFILEKPALTTRTQTCIQLRQECFELEVSDTDKKRSKGLSDRASLPEDQGMLFIFDEAVKQCFWMKDMKFNIDMIWTDKQRKILKIEENVSPDTYPTSFCADNTKYVLEFNQGFAAKYGLKVGTTLQF